MIRGVTKGTKDEAWLLGPCGNVKRPRYLQEGGQKKGAGLPLRFQMNSGYATWPLSDIAEHHAAPTAKKNKTKARTQTCTHKCADSEKAGRTLL